MVLQYLRQTGKSDYAVEKRALEYIQDGYNRLINYETAEGGFDYWGGSKANLRLTAYGLLQFYDMQKVYSGVDQKLIKRTKDFLIKKFNKNIEGEDGYLGDKDVLKAYVLYVLSIVDSSSFVQLKPIYNEMLNRSNDPYILSLMTMAAYHFDQKEDYSQLNVKLHHLIEKNQAKDIKSKETLVIAYSKDNNTESIALIAQALLLDQKSAHLVKKCIEHVITKYSHGNFGSTQATCMALKTFINFALNHNSKEDIDMHLSSGVDTLFVNNKKKIFTQEITPLIQANKICLKFRNNLNDSTANSFDFTYLSRTINDSDLSLLKMKTSISKANVTLGEISNLELQLTNIDNANPVFHPTAVIGIPSGMTLNLNLLNDLVEMRDIEAFEIFNNYLVIYLSKLNPSENKKINITLKAEIAGIFQAPASTSYLYYDRENKVYNDGLKVNIYKSLDYEK
jgi:uncharacterized protein YfaS (alpha-2-macroglobulin family)